MYDFLTDDSGGATIDWVVLTAAACAICLSAVALLSSGPRSLGQATGTTVAEVEVARVAPPD